ncbi:MAG: glycosyltransferase family 2 protein [candidate division WOR-3 bacterium]|nr:glycosyltransferase family 2 protein [candidate division WOR-3 bacterium]
MVSILIITWNSKKYLKPCLDSILLQEQFKFFDYEIVVIDNNSQDGTVNIIEKSYSQVRLIKNAVNVGYAKANNQGIKIIRSEYILLLNPDTILRDNFFPPLIEYLKQNPRVGAIAPKILNPDLTIQDSVRAFPSYSILLWELTGLSRLFPQHKTFGRWRMKYFDYNQISEIDQPMASCLLVRKEAIEQIGGFDERFPMFYNDVDFCLRLKRAGWKIVYFPDSSVIHYRGASTKIVRTKMIFSMHKSLYHYFEKYDTSRWWQIKKLFLYPMLIFSALIRTFSKKL